jgi:hypothetical protein
MMKSVQAKGKVAVMAESFDYKTLIALDSQISRDGEGCDFVLLDTKDADGGFCPDGAPDGASMKHKLLDRTAARAVLFVLCAALVAVMVCLVVLELGNHQRIEQAQDISFEPQAFLPIRHLSKRIALAVRPATVCTRCCRSMLTMQIQRADTSLSKGQTTNLGWTAR